MLGLKSFIQHQHVGALTRGDAAQGLEQAHGFGRVDGGCLQGAFQLYAEAHCAAEAFGKAGGACLLYTSRCV